MLLIVSGVLVGCGGGGSADYTLHLTPVVASPQTPFDGLDRIDLVLTPADGDPLRVPLDTPSSGSTPEVSGLPELVETRITVEGYRDGELVLRGLTEPLSAKTGRVEADVFVASTETTAWLGALADGLYLPMLAPLGGGQFWLAGGLANNLNNEPERGQKTTWRLSLAPPDEGLAFVAQTDLPAYEANDGEMETARAGATCTPLSVAGSDEGKLLVTGGAGTDPLNAGGEATSSVSLYDPATDTWEELPALSALDEPRAMHLALENILGNVVVYGGYGPQVSGGVSLNTSVEYYDRASRKLSSLGDTALGSLDAMIADLGSEGTLLCGGTRFTGEGLWESADTCVRVRLDGSGLDDFASLQEGLVGAAMVALDNGQVLLTGGATTDGAGNTEFVPARATAWLYNPSTSRWGALPATMTMPRAGHKMVRLEDGRVLIAGGAQSYNTNYFPTDPVSCLEIYDPVGGTFSAVDGCDEEQDAGGLPGRAFLPQVAYDPDYGVLIVGGVGSDGSAQGGVSLFVPGF